MKVSLIWIAAALILLAPPVAWACGPSYIYFYDEEYDGGGFGDCSGDLAPGAPLVVHVLLDSYAFPQPIQQVHFRVHDWIGNPGEPLGQVTEHWSADQVSGSLGDEGITLVWDDGLTPSGGGPGAHYELGYFEIEAFSPDWVEDGHLMRPFDLQYTDVAGWDYEGADEGNPDWASQFTINGYGYEPCLDYVWDPGPWRGARHFLPEDGELVAPVFPFQFQVISISCESGMPYPFEGVVSLEGQPIAEFAWDGLHAIYDFSFDVDASAYPPLSTVEVEVYIEFYGGTTREYLLEYLIADTTPTEEIDFSRLKSLYR